MQGWQIGSCIYFVVLAASISGKVVSRFKMFCRLQSILSEAVPSPLSRTQRGPAQHPKQDGFESYEKNMIFGA